MDLGGSTATGPRDANEDNFYVIDFSDVQSFSNGVTSFVMVSDGMGGYQGGDVASGLAVSSAESYIRQLLDMAAGNQIDFDAVIALSEISQNAHEAILAETRERGNASMGATFVGAFLSPTHAWIGHVGDSRAYLIRGGEATQLTEDHSQVGRMLSRGLITEEEAQNHPARNRIERALGFSDADPEINEIDLQPGDALLLCSDGVYTVLDSKAIATYARGERSAESAAARVVNKALSKGTDDNSTVAIALNIDSAQSASRKRSPQPTIRTKAVSQPRHAASERYRADGYASAARQRATRVSQGSTDGRSSSSQDARYLARERGRFPLTIAIPVVVIVVLAAVLVVVFLLNSGGESSGGGADSSQQQVSEASQGQGQRSSATAAYPASAESSTASQAGNQGDLNANAASQASSQSDWSTSTTPQAGNQATSYFTVVQPAQLKYVDATGEAQLFSDDPLYVNSTLLIDAGQSISAETEPSSYGIEGRSYRALSDNFRSALLNDLANYKSGNISINSVLSQVVDSGEYLQFLGSLAAIDSSASLSSTVSKLVVDASCLQS